MSVPAPDSVHPRVGDRSSRCACFKERKSHCFYHDLISFLNFRLLRYTRKVSDALLLGHRDSVPASTARPALSASQPSAIPKTRRSRAVAPLSLGRRNDERWWCRASPSWLRAIVNDRASFRSSLTLSNPPLPSHALDPFVKTSTLQRW